MVDLQPSELRGSTAPPVWSRHPKNAALPRMRCDFALPHRLQTEDPPVIVRAPIKKVMGLCS